MAHAVAKLHTHTTQCSIRALFVLAYNTKRVKKLRLAQAMGQWQAATAADHHRTISLSLQQYDAQLQVGGACSTWRCCDLTRPPFSRVPGTASCQCQAGCACRCQQCSSYRRGRVGAAGEGGGQPRCVSIVIVCLTPPLPLSLSSAWSTKRQRASWHECPQRTPRLPHEPLCWPILLMSELLDV